MTLLKRLKFALTYDFDPEFVVYNFEHQLPYKFMKYEDAEAHSEEQIQYRPAIFVAVRKNK